MSNPFKEAFFPLKIGGKYIQFKLGGEIEKRGDVEIAAGKSLKLARLKAIRRLVEVLSSQL